MIHSDSNAATAASLMTLHKRTKPARQGLVNSDRVHMGAACTGGRRVQGQTCQGAGEPPCEHSQAQQCPPAMAALTLTRTRLPIQRCLVTQTYPAGRVHEVCISRLPHTDAEMSSRHIQ